MSPRRYQLGRRQAAADKTRAKILRVARDLLTAKGGTGRFSLDAVARRAGVARMTVYYQFKSRRGLFEALFDHNAERSQLPRQFAAAFQQADPQDTLAGIVLALARFWDRGRPWIRRVRALGVLDRELGAALAGRDARRRHALQAALQRLGDERPETLDTLYALTSFEALDVLAGPQRRLEDVVPVVLRAARAAGQQ